MFIVDLTDLKNNKVCVCVLTTLRLSLSILTGYRQFPTLILFNKWFYQLFDVTLLLNLNKFNSENFFSYNYQFIKILSLHVNQSNIIFSVNKCI